MTKYKTGDRVTSTITAEERKENADAFREMVLIYVDEEDENLKVDYENNLNSPIVGDVGTVVSAGDDDEDLSVLVEWDRPIGPVAGARTTENQWFMHASDLTPAEAQANAA